MRYEKVAEIFVVQRRIQDFPYMVPAPKNRGANLLFGQISMKIMKIGLFYFAKKCWYNFLKLLLKYRNQMDL